jgi:nucleoside 2-deoxyribosyltransferase
MKKIYIAGFDVFKPNSIEIGALHKSTCKEYGYEGLYPLDNQIDESWSKEVAREFIYKKNIELIEMCDIVIANGNPFRGDELDSGTAFEIGYALALKKEVIIYMDDCRDYIQKSTCKDKNNPTIDKKGMFIEDFGFSLNLMFSACRVVNGGFKEAIKTLS